MAKQFDGITKDGGSIEKFLDAQDPQETMLGDYHHLKRKARVKYMDHKEPNGEVKQTNQIDLNRINLTGNLQLARNNIHRAIAYLSAGKTCSSMLLHEKIKCSKIDGATILRKIFKSPLGEFVERTADGKGWNYVMTEDGLHTPFNDACLIYAHKSEPKIDDIPEPAKQKIHIPPEDSPILRPAVAIPVEKDVVINVTVKLKIEVI